MNVAGNQVETEEEAVGQKVTHVVKHPQYMMFIDKVLNNTNMKDDGNIGGEKLLKSKGNKARILASTADQHFTVLGFTAGTGKSVMCCIIFSGNKLIAKKHLGVDIQADLVPGEFFMRRNHGPGKRYPGGPTCIFRGKEVPAFVCCFPKGDISSDLLMQMLKRMDTLALFPRLHGGPLPFILLDGHGSRLNFRYLSTLTIQTTSGRCALVSLTERLSGKSETCPNRMGRGKWQRQSTSVSWSSSNFEWGCKYR